MNAKRKTARGAALGLAVVTAMLASACTGGIPPAEIPSPSATGIPSPLPISYAWVRAQLDGAERGEFVAGDPQDTFERLRGRVEGDRMVVELGYQSRGVAFVTPPLRGGSRYIVGGGEGELTLTLDGSRWVTGRAGRCSIIFSYVRGAQIPFTVPEGYIVYEVDAGFVCTALESPARMDERLSVIDGSMHFFFAVSSKAGSEAQSAGSHQRTSTETIPPTG